ncbi:hypothetical protein [Promicromonospora sp. NPDC023805]|uniref:hypothetical protein n=1 Tax=Promicromonospora sp. NPDC023805 TaxID=3154696 RepID=UPI0033D2688B
MNPTPGKRPVNLTVAIVILWIQAVTNLGFGLVLLAEFGQGPGAGLFAAAGLVSVLAAPVFVVGAVGLTGRKVWVRVPVIVVEGLTILSGLVTVVLTVLAGGAPTAIVGTALAIVVLQGCFSKESEAWLNATETSSEAPPRVAP